MAKGDRVEERAQGDGVDGEQQDTGQEPWWHYTDWFEGLSVTEMMKRLELSGDLMNAPRGDYIVVPQMYLWRAESRVREQVARGMDVAALAERIYMAMLQRDGYSTEHVKRAWEQAEAFVKRAVGAGVPAGGGQ